jgi:hypothetical protein
MTQQIDATRIAMWSGPRNISTALMRSWGNRPDTVVCDEPFYAHYLSHTRLPHPGAEGVIEAHETDCQKVVCWLTGPLPTGKTVFYQKHMAHHLLSHMELSWLDQLTNCFLIRDPREMLTSLIDFIPQPRVEDTGLPQQVRMFERERARLDAVPPVLDAKDILEHPGDMLRKLCRTVGVAFDVAMLQWPPGLRVTDGIWAKHWYHKVENTTGFAPYRPKNIPVPDELSNVLAECRRLYQQLSANRIAPDA